MEETTIDKLNRIEEEFRKNSSMIYHSTPLTTYQEGPQLDLRDLHIAGAISGRNILISGGTGVAKTHLGKLALASFYGSNNYGVVQVNPNLTEEKLWNIDFGAIKDGKKLTDLLESTQLITGPGVLIDEANRAPAAIVNVLQAYVNNENVTPGGGKEQPVGVLLKNGERYQFKIGTCNEGKQYEEGIWPMDPAFRRRFAIEIPANLFAATEKDNKERIKKDFHAGHPVPETKGTQREILEIYHDIKTIELHPVVEEFLAYLGRMNNCGKSIYHTKDELGFTLERCEACHGRALAGAQNFCGNAYALPTATQNDLNAVARAFALLRARHNPKVEVDKIQVLLDDIVEAFPFIAAQKLRFDPAWVKKEFTSGEPHEAARALTVNLKQKIQDKIRKLNVLAVKDTYTEDEEKQLRKYAEEDPWSTGLRDCDYRG